MVPPDHAQEGSVDRLGVAEHLSKVFIRTQKFGMSLGCSICSEVGKPLEMDFQH